MSEDNMSMAAFIESAGLRMTAKAVDSRPGQMGEDATMDHWKCLVTSSKKRGQMLVYFSMGSGHHGKAPELADVLDSMASDAAGVETPRTSGLRVGARNTARIPTRARLSGPTTSARRKRRGCCGSWARALTRRCSGILSGCSSGQSTGPRMVYAGTNIPPLRGGAGGRKRR